MKDRKQIKLIQSGHKDELEILIYQTYFDVYSFVFRKLGDRERAFDITQETYLRFMKSLEHYVFKGKTLHYLYRIACNLCNDYFRTCYREEEIEEVEASDPLPIDIVLAKERKREISDYLKMLSEEQKEVIILKYYHGLKAKEIANILDCREATIKSRLRLGIRKLQELMREGGKNE